MMHVLLFIMSFQILLTYSQKCTGGLDSKLETGVLDGCDNKCIYHIANENLWQPEFPINITTPDAGPVYFSSLTCPANKTNVMMEIESKEKNFVVCVAPIDAGTCFNRDSVGDDIEGLKCFATGGMLGGNDGILEGIGEGTWVFSVQHKEGEKYEKKVISLESIQFSCTDKSSPWWAKYLKYIIGGASGLVLLCCLKLVGFQKTYDMVCCLFGETSDEDEVTSVCCCC
jgi:hypothetical protein